MPWSQASDLIRMLAGIGSKNSNLLLKEGRGIFVDLPTGLGPDSMAVVKIT